MNADVKKTRLKNLVFKELHPEDSRMTIAKFVILLFILISSMTVIIETELELKQKWISFFVVAEVFFGVVFAFEYAARLWVAPMTGVTRLKHFFKPLSVIDLIVVLGTLAPMLTGDILIIRLVRIIRLLKVGRYTNAFTTLERAIRACGRKLIAAGVLMMIFLVLSASALHFVEASAQPNEFGSIPRSLWWAVTTITTVGYGDVTPLTFLGRMISGVIMFTGIAVVAIPVGLIASSFVELDKQDKCLECLKREQNK